MRTMTLAITLALTACTADQESAAKESGEPIGQNEHVTSTPDSTARPQTSDTVQERRERRRSS